MIESVEEDAAGNEISGTERNYTIDYTEDGRTEKVEGTIPDEDAKLADSEVLEWDSQFDFLPRKVKSFEFEYIYEYDDNGNKTKTTITHNGQSIESAAGYNDDNTVAWAKDAMNNSTYFDYTNGNLTSITPPNAAGTTTIKRKSDGSVEKITSPTGVVTRFEDFK